VWFLDRGMKHTAHVDARSVFEAAALALKSFQHTRGVRGPSKRDVLTIEAADGRRFAVRTEQLLDWLYARRDRTPEQAERVKWLRDLLADDRH
jgi:hypothetical protein